MFKIKGIVRLPIHGPGTKLKKRLARGDPGINRLNKIAKQHDIDYARAKNLQEK